MLRLRRALAVVLVLSGAAMAQLPAAAAPVPAPAKQGQIQALKDQVGVASVEELALLDKINASNARRSDLDAKLADLDGRIANVQRDLEQAQQRLDDLEVRKQAAETDLSQAGRDLAVAKEQLARRAVAAYTGQPPLAVYADLVLRVRDMRELAASSGYMSAVLDAQAEAVRRYQVLRDHVERLRNDVDRRRDEALRQRDEVASRRRELDVNRQAQGTLRQEVGAEIARQDAMLAEVQARKVQFEAQIAALQQQSNDLANILRALQNGQAPGPSGKGLLAMPVPGATVTSPFGPRVHPLFGSVGMHTGTDLAVPMGTPIYAAADGTVVSAGPMGGYGNATVLDHGNALATLYGHQSVILVKAGDRVTRGQVIGLVGCTGSCTGPHLHFEVRVGGNPVDPMPYL